MEEQIKSTVNEAIGALKIKQIDEPINWGNLHCHKVEKLSDNVYKIYIEEASPYCPKFQKYIVDYIQERFDIIAWVVTKW